MIDNKRLAEILQPFGTLEETASQEERSLRVAPDLLDGIWTIPLDEQQVLRVEDGALPPAVAQLLALYVESLERVHPRGNAEQLLADWFADDRVPDREALAHALQEIGWTAQGVYVVVFELVKEQPDVAMLLDDAVHLLEELLGEETAFVVRQGQARMYLLLHSPGNESLDLSAWLDTLGTELFLLFRAGVSAEVTDLRELLAARSESEFALEAGKRFRSRELIHAYDKLGLARLLHGVPHTVRDRFLQEVLPEAVLHSLSQELRETIFAFLENGQQV
ncbi:MAG: hypothetical protein ACXVPK_12535, partial [Tumebacillaceae bacterium]